MSLPTFPVPEEDRRRVEILGSYQLDGSTPEAAFDHVVQQAVDIFQVPTAMVSFVERDRQFFKARIGFAACSTSRDTSFCAHALISDDVMVVPDARADDRFARNPLVVGEPFIRFYAGSPIVVPGGHRLGTVCLIDTEPRDPLTEREVRILRGLARTVVDHLERRRLLLVSRAAMRMAAATPDAIVCSDDAGVITFWNDAAERIFGHPRDEVIGAPLAMLVPDEFLGNHHAWMRELLSGHAVPSREPALEVRAKRRDGTQFPIEISVATWKQGDRRHVGSIVRDLSERDQARERVRFLTHFDRLTDLPNRVAFLEQVEKTLRMVGRFTLMKVGLDRFKALNGTMGMAAGDLILIEAARRIRTMTGPDAFSARLGGDEFGILIPGGGDPVAAGLVAERVLRQIEAPFQVGASHCRVDASIGVVTCSDPSHFDDADAAMKAALLALLHAKANGGRRHTSFTLQLGRQADERRAMEEELRGAQSRGEFELHFQPQVTLPDARVVGAEALLRWRHPVRGLLSPAVFLPVLEASDIATDVGRWIVARSCSFAAEMAAGGRPITVGVNLFAAQLRDATFHDDVVAALEAAGLPDGRLELEITETTVLSLDEATIEPLRRLRARGVGVAFDDYGTGYASLSLLKRYPLTRLKIDREFVRDLETDTDDAAIVRAVIALGSSLGLDVIAEGIETTEQAAVLAGYGCPQAQGYLFGRPMPAREFAAFVSAAHDFDA
jgi:PAS domain S-box-containing protein/diguanylate cyclase (GGDEF)-like protein